MKTWLLAVGWGTHMDVTDFPGDDRSLGVRRSISPEGLGVTDGTKETG